MRGDPHVRMGHLGGRIALWKSIPRSEVATRRENKEEHMEGGSEPQRAMPTRRPAVR